MSWCDYIELARDVEPREAGPTTTTTTTTTTTEQE